MTPELPQLQLPSQMTTVIPNVDSLIGDLLDMNPPLAQQPPPSMMASSMGPGGPGQGSSAIVDLLGDGLDTFVRKQLSGGFTYLTVYLHMSIICSQAFDLQKFVLFGNLFFSIQYFCFSCNLKSA